MPDSGISLLYSFAVSTSYVCVLYLIPSSIQKLPRDDPKQVCYFNLCNY